MIKRFIPLAFLSTTCAFQVAPTLRSRSIPSRVLIPHHNAAASKVLLHRPTPLTALRMLGSDDDAGDAIESHPAELIEPDLDTSLDNNNNNALVNFISNLKQTLQTSPATFLLSISIFLLPFFLVSAFPESAWAVQSGGRMGGSFGGSSRQSSSRSYSSGSYSAPSARGYSRGYSSGYYSRPNVIVSPGISPYYR